MFQRIKRFNGLEYAYLVRNERIGNSVRQKVVKYLGPIEPIYNKVKKRTRKSNAWLFARKPTKSEVRELKKALASTSSFTRDRASIILSSIEGDQCNKIATRMRFDKRKVREAIKSFNNKGLFCLQRGKAMGAVPQFTGLNKKIILMHYSKSPREFSYHFTTWTLPRFREHLIDCRVVDSISIETVRQIIMKAGAKLKRSKRWQYSPDKDFVKKNLQ